MMKHVPFFRSTETMCSPLANCDTGSPKEPVGVSTPKADTRAASQKKDYSDDVVKSSPVPAPVQKLQPVPTASLCNGDLSLKVGHPTENGTPSEKTKC